MKDKDLRGWFNYFDEGIDEESARKILWKLISAISYLHDIGVFHRDIKMENLILDNDLNDAMLIDFGMSTTVDLLKDNPTEYCGTLMTIAPEMMLG